MEDRKEKAAHPHMMKNLRNLPLVLPRIPAHSLTIAIHQFIRIRHPILSTVSWAVYVLSGDTLCGIAGPSCGVPIWSAYVHGVHQWMPDC